MTRPGRTSARLTASLAVVALIAASCSSDGGTPLASGVEPGTVMVEPDPSYPVYTVNVYLTDTGFEPEILILPAGRAIQLILREGGTTEHHYRIKGLIAAQLQWISIPEVTEYDLESMSPAELLARGIDLEAMDGSDPDHALHHLGPTWAPVRERSPAGIKPLGTEVHGYVTLGSTDAISFYPVNTGRFEVEDVLFPEITGTVIVFLPPEG